MNKQNKFILPKNPIVLGKLSSAYGIQGWIKLISFTDHVENIFSYQPWFIKRSNQWENIEVKNWKYINNNIILKLKKINNRNLASLLTNFEINVDSNKLTKLNEEYY